MLHNPILLIAAAFALMIALPQITKLFAKYGGNKVDPKANAKSIEGYTLTAELVAKWVATIITSIGFFIWGKQLALSYNPDPALANIVGGIMAILSGWLTDFAFSHFLENVMFDFFAFFQFRWVKNKQGIFGVCIGLLRWLSISTIVALLFYADYKSVYTLRDPVASQAKQGVLFDTDSLSRAQLARTREAVSDDGKEIASLQKSIENRAAQVAASNAGLTKLIADGNPWAQSELAKKIRTANSEDNKLLSAAKQRRQVKQARQLQQDSVEMAYALAANGLTFSGNVESKTAISTMFTTFGFGAKILTILCRLLLVLSFLAKGIYDADGDGVIDGKDVTADAKKPQQNVNVRVNGETVPQSTPPLAVAQATPTPTSQAQQGIGFHDRYKAPTPTPEQQDAIQKSGLWGKKTQTAPTDNTVAQCSTVLEPKKKTVAQDINIELNIPAEKPTETVVKRSSEWVVAGLAEWKMRYGLYLDRAEKSQGREAQEDNQARAECYRKMIEAAGYKVHFDPNSRPKVEAQPIAGAKPDSLKIEEQVTILRELSGKRSQRETR